MSETRAVGLLVLVAALVRLLAWHQTAVLFNDGPAFLEIARAMEAGDWQSALGHDYHPLYSFLTLVAHWLGLGWESAAVSVSIVSGALSVALLHRLVCAELGARAAWLAALVLAVHPRAVQYSCDVQSDGLYLALWLGALVLVAKGLREQRAAIAAWAGVLSGLAYLTRPEGLGVVVVGIGLVGLAGVRRAWSPGKVAVWAGALALGAVMLMAPYVTTLSLEQGSPTVTRKKSILHRPQGEGQASPGIVRAEGKPAPSTPPRVSARVGKPGAAAAELVRTVRSSARSEFLVLIAFGLWCARGRPGRFGEMSGAVGALFLLVLSWLVYTSGYVSQRHALPPLVPLFGYAGVALAVIGKAIGQHIGRWVRADAESRASAGTAVVAVLLLTLGVGHAFREKRADVLAERQAAEWLAATGSEVGAVASLRTRIAYYAGASWVPLGAAPPLHLVEYLRNVGVRYVVVDEEDLSEHAELARAVRARLDPVHRLTAKEHTASVYAVPSATGRGR